VLVPHENAMAEYFQVPTEYVLTLPGGKSDEEFLMAQQLGTVVYACKHLPNLVGRTAVVIGQGSAGLHWDAMLRRLGLAQIVGLDLHQARVDAATRFGATDALRLGPGDPRHGAKEAIADMTGGGMADLVVMAAGEKEAIQMAPDLVATGGRIQFFGVPHETEILFDFKNLFRSYCTTHSTGGPAAEPGLTSFRQALRLVGDGEIDVRGMVTHHLPLERAFAAYELARTRDDGAVKIVVEVGE
jgi:L-iditol 2-dehydrogenase